MLAYIYQALQTFRKVFSRRATWLTFCIVVLGFLGATQIDGVSSLCRFWHLETPGYLAFTPSLSFLGLEPDGVALVLVGLCRESATNRDG